MAILRSDGDSSDEQAGYLAEFDFLREGLRQDQRERHIFLGFALAASGTVLGLLVRRGSPLSPGEALFLIETAAGITVIAEILTVRATYGVANAGAYLRKFVEPHVTGLNFQSRHAHAHSRLHFKISSSAGLAAAYGMLTAAFVVAWLTVPTIPPAGTLRTVIVFVSALVGVWLAVRIWWASKKSPTRFERLWTAVEEAETRPS